MRFERSSGILMHPTSLPGPYGIGDLGPQAYHWVDFLAEAGCKLWQTLPLGPTGYADSPYQCFSAFAGNPYLISPDGLVKTGLLVPDELKNVPSFPDDQVDYGAVIPWKLSLLDKAYYRFVNTPSAMLGEFKEFCQEQSEWLDEFSLFMALKESYGGRPWSEWSAELRMRDAQALENARKKHAGEIDLQKFRQFIFFWQWKTLRQYANDKSVKIIGDIPIFVAMDSSDVWTHPDLFYLDEQRNPTVVAGVPPDYFSPTGQLWGNPLYRWDAHKQTGFSWWLKRFQAAYQLVDIIRLDHFRGFAGYWEIPAGNPTAEHGRWVPAPGMDLFQAMEDALGELPIIAEDLGVITPDVVELRDSFDLPGMKTLQFGFTGPDNEFLPHHYPHNCVTYTGTHDNDTGIGWYDSAPEHEKDFARRYMGRNGSDFAWDMIRTCWASVAVMALAPTQDFLRLGTEARMNYPSTIGGNWQWRMSADALTDKLKNRLFELNQLYSR
jgi:4-alpha-glucanotransferase